METLGLTVPAWDAPGCGLNSAEGLTVGFRMATSADGWKAYGKRKNCKPHQGRGSRCLALVPACVYIIRHSPSPSSPASVWSVTTTGKTIICMLLHFCREPSVPVDNLTSWAMMDHLGPYALKDTHTTVKPKIMSHALLSPH